MGQIQKLTVETFAKKVVSGGAGQVPLALSALCRSRAVAIAQRSDALRHFILGIA